MKALLLTLSIFHIVLLQAQTTDPFLKEKGIYGKNRWTIKDSAVVNDLNKESGKLAFSESRRAELLARYALKISSKIEYYEGKVESYLSMSNAKIHLNEKDSAMHYVNLAEALAVKRGFKRLEVKCIERRGSVHVHMEQYDLATKAYFDAIKKGSKLGERETIKSYTNLGVVFKKLGNIERSRDYSKKAYNLGKKYRDTASMVNALNLLGLADKNQDKFESALKYYQEGLELARAINNLERQSQILYNMSNVYFAQDNYDEGIKYFNESIEISKSNESYLSTAISFHSLAFNYYELGRTKKSDEIADSALHYALLSKNYEMITQAYAMKAEIAYELMNDEEAYIYMGYAYIYKDSMNLAQLNEAALSAEDAFNREREHIKDSLFQVQKQLEMKSRDKINAQRLKSRDTLIWIFAFVIVLALIGGYFLIKNNRLIKIQNALVNTQKEEIQLQHSEITDSINYAKRIQEAMINKHSEWEKISPQHYIFFRPKDVVSGDFYWAYNRENISIWAVADCTGHGVPGAFMSMLGFGFLNEIIIEGKITDPAEILNHLRSKIISALGQQGENQSRDGMDISICTWDKSSNELMYAGANNPLWLIRHNSSGKPSNVKRVTSVEDSALELLEIEPDKMPVGFTGTKSTSFTKKTMQLYPGDMIIQLTDGFADQFGGDRGKKLKYAPLKRALLEQQKLQVSAQIDAISKLFDEWRGELEQVDDVCLVAVKVP